MNPHVGIGYDSCQDESNTFPKMPRRSNQGDPETIRQKLIDLLTNFESNLRKHDLRDQVVALIPIHHKLRDLGGSLKGFEGITAGMDRVLEYMKKYCGVVLRGDELMVVSGIHDYPRRIRQLRKELGWQIVSGVMVNAQKQDDNEQQLELKKTETWPDMRVDDYILVSRVQDREAAFRWKVANTIRKGPGSVQDKILRFLLQNVNRPVTGEELRYIAKNKTEWARRTRELRTEEGWTVATKSTGRPDLPVGVYVLESDKQGLRHDRKIPDRTRRAVLRRDNYTCQYKGCGWNHEQWNQDDPRHLEVHHKQHHVKGGGQDEENLLTLCNVHHDEVHAMERLKD